MRMLPFVLMLMTTWQMPAQTKASTASGAGSQAQKWTGRLVDAGRSECGVEVAGAAPKGMCPVSVNTTVFGLVTSDGKTLKFDEGGNTKAMDGLKKSKKASKLVTDFWRTGKTSGQVQASVAGTLTSDTLNVETIRVE